MTPSIPSSTNLAVLRYLMLLPLFTRFDQLTSLIGPQACPARIVDGNVPRAIGLLAGDFDTILLLYHHSCRSSESSAAREHVELWMTAMGH